MWYVKQGIGQDTLSVKIVLPIPCLPRQGRFFTCSEGKPTPARQIGVLALFSLVQRIDIVNAFSSGSYFIYERKKGWTLININFASSTYTPFANYPDILTVEQLQAALGVGRSTAYKLIHKNEIGHIRIGNSIKIPKLALINYISEYDNAMLCYNGPCNGQANQAVRKEFVLNDSQP